MNNRGNKKKALDAVGKLLYKETQISKLISIEDLCGSYWTPGVKGLNLLKTTLSRSFILTTKLPESLHAHSIDLRRVSLQIFECINPLMPVGNKSSYLLKQTCSL